MSICLHSSHFLLRIILAEFETPDNRYWWRIWNAIMYLLIGITCLVWNYMSQHISHTFHVSKGTRYITVFAYKLQALIQTHPSVYLVCSLSLKRPWSVLVNFFFFVKYLKNDFFLLPLPPPKFNENLFCQIDFLFK